MSTFGSNSSEKEMLWFRVEAAYEESGMSVKQFIAFLLEIVALFIERHMEVSSE